MTLELVYTSAEKGLRRGATGYCTVARSADLTAELADRLETLSHYRHRVKGAEPDPGRNPTAFAHQVLAFGIRRHHVLARIADAGFDHTGRSNYLAHYLVLDQHERTAAGPAWVLQQDGLFEPDWPSDRPPELRPGGKTVPAGVADPRPCREWEDATGDAGWAGVLAAATDPGQPAYVVFAPGQDVLALVAEALALLPPADRWAVTFSTYYTEPAAAECQWRCVPADSPEARAALSARRGVVIRVDRPVAEEPTGPLVEAARTGVVPGAAKPAAARHSAPARPAAAPPAYTRPHRPPAAADLPPAEEYADDLTDAEEPRDYRPAPAPAAAAPRGGGGVKSLVLGLALGLLLAVVGVGVVELAAGRSLPRFAGVVGKDEQELKKKLEAAESDAAKATDLARDTEAKLKAHAADADADRLRWGDERGKLQGKLTDAGNKVREATEKVTTLETELKLAKTDSEGKKKTRKDALDQAKQELETAKKEVTDLTARLKALNNQPVIVGVPTDLGKLTKDKLPAVLFGVGPGDGEPVIELLGLPDTLTPTPAKGPKVKLTDKADDKFAAELAADPDGTVRLVNGDKLTAHPTLGLAVIKVTRKNGPPAYRQLFRPADSQLVRGPLIRSKGDEQVFEGELDPRQFTTPLLRDEWKSLDRAWLAPGRVAQVRVFLAAPDTGKDYDLEPTDKPGELECRAPAATDPAVRLVRLVVREGKVVVTVATADKAAAPPRMVQVTGLELHREVKGLGGPGQVVFRVR